MLSKLKQILYRKVEAAVQRIMHRKLKVSAFNKTEAVANYGDSDFFTLYDSFIIAKSGRVVRRIDLWKSNKTHELHVVASNYTRPNETIRHDLPFSPHDTGRRLTNPFQAVTDADELTNFTKVVKEMAEYQAEHKVSRFHEYVLDEEGKPQKVAR